MHPKMTEKFHTIKVLKEVIGLSRYSLTLALTPLSSQTKQEHWLAAQLRMEALVAVWEMHIEEKNQQTAEALIATANKHTKSSWWVDHKETLYSELVQEL